MGKYVLLSTYNLPTTGETGGKIYPSQTISSSSIAVKCETAPSSTSAGYVWAYFKNEGGTSGFCFRTQYADEGLNYFNYGVLSEEHTYRMPSQATRTEEISGNTWAFYDFDEPLILQAYQRNLQMDFVMISVVAFEPDKDVFNFTMTGGTDTFTLEASTNWSAETESDWVSVSPSTGTTGGTISLTCTENNTDISRTATITFTDEDEDTFDITVNQKKGIPPHTIRKMYRN